MSWMNTPLPALLQVIQQGELRGAEVFALDLSRALAREGSWGVSVLSLFGMDDAFAAAADRAGVEPISVAPQGQARGFDLRVVGRLRAVIEGTGYQVVQANGAATLKYLAIARRLSRRPWSLVYRAIGMGSFWRRSPARRLAYRWLLAQPDVVVAVSRAVADDLAAGARTTRVVVVPNGVDAQRISCEPEDRERTRRALGVGTGDALLVYVGSLAQEKNLVALVDVVAQCREHGIPVHAVLVGDGPCRDQLRSEADRRQVAGVVHFLPGQGRVGPFFAAADVCVLPSLSEGMPALIIEAGLAGIPAVAYGVGGIREVLEHDVTGLIVPANDQSALAHAVAALLRDGARRVRMGRAARTQYQRFEITEIARAYRQMYGSLVNGLHPSLHTA